MSSSASGSSRVRMRMRASRLIGWARSRAAPSSWTATAFLARDFEIDSATSRPVTPDLKAREEPSGNVREICDIVLLLSLLRTGAGKRLFLVGYGAFTGHMPWRPGCEYATGHSATAREDGVHS